MDDELLDRDLAETYAGWFRALADPSRVQILHLLASAGRSMPVGEIVSRVHIGQSTVSHHLATLAESRFVLVERVGTARLYRVNDACISCFPSAADVVMGRRPAIPEETGNARRAAR
jgi:ArsR family transcriptional regulator, arsenate/arsenite/antimonite-responsive transcriptional repressor